jgi:hypothetical protein
MEIQDIHIILVLAGAVLGITIILILLKIISSIFSGLIGGFRRDYPPTYDEREPRRSGCFIPFVLLISLGVFGVKTLHDQGILRPNIEVVKPAQTTPATTPPASVPLQSLPPREPDYDEVPEYDDMPEDSDMVEPEMTKENNESFGEPEPNNPHLLQTNFFFDASNARRRMSELAEYELEVGMYLKEVDGRTGYGVYVGPFNSRTEALEMKAAHGLKGDVIPCDQLQLLRYEGN